LLIGHVTKHSCYQLLSSSQTLQSESERGRVTKRLKCERERSCKTMQCKFNRSSHS